MNELQRLERENRALQTALQQQVAKNNMLDVLLRSAAAGRDVTIAVDDNLAAGQVVVSVETARRMTDDALKKLYDDFLVSFDIHKAFMIATFNLREIFRIVDVLVGSFSQPAERFDPAERQRDAALRDALDAQRDRALVAYYDIRKVDRAMQTRDVEKGIATPDMTAGWRVITAYLTALDAFHDNPSPDALEKLRQLANDYNHYTELTDLATRIFARPGRGVVPARHYVGRRGYDLARLKQFSRAKNAALGVQILAELNALDAPTAEQVAALAWLSGFENDRRALAKEVGRAVRDYRKMLQT